MGKLTDRNSLSPITDDGNDFLARNLDNSLPNSNYYFDRYNLEGTPTSNHYITGNGYESLNIPSSNVSSNNSSNFKSFCC